VSILNEIYELLDQVESKYGEDSDEVAEAGYTLNQASSELQQLKQDLKALLDTPTSTQGTQP
jgi:hypothetical protein